MSISPAVKADGDPLDEFVNNASKASEAAAKLPANVVGAAPIAVMIGPTAATLVDVMYRENVQRPAVVTDSHSRRDARYITHCDLVRHVRVDLLRFDILRTA